MNSLTTVNHISICTQLKKCDICTCAKHYVLWLIYYTQSFHEKGGAILHLCIIESTYQVSYFYLMTKSEPGSKKGVSLSENEAMENTQRVT